MSRIFVLNAENRLTRLEQADYDSEDLLQRLLADHPDLIAAALGVEALLLIRREAGMPDAEGGVDRWSLDHLFLDAAGVPVLVEVKRACDTRNRSRPRFPEAVTAPHAPHAARRHRDAPERQFVRHPRTGPWQGCSRLWARTASSTSAATRLGCGPLGPGSRSSRPSAP